MYLHLKKIFFFITFCLLANISILKAETLDIKEVLEIIQKDLRTLERAIYSQSFSESSDTNTSQRISEDLVSKKYKEKIYLFW